MNGEWISVKDRLPEIDMDGPAHARYAKVLASNGRGNVTMLRYESDAYAKTERGRLPKWRELYGRLANDVVTHWMPLPDPPEERP